jgi:multidrug resistance protein, MATE family
VTRPVDVSSSEPTAAEELRALLVLSWPIMIAQLLAMSMGLVETAIVGRVSTTELAGVAIGRSVAFAASMIAFGVSAGLEPLASQAVGAGDEDRAWAGLMTTLRAVLAMWPMLMIATLGISFLLESMGIDHAIAVRARDYEIGQAPGLALVVVYFSAKTFLQAHGKTRPAVVGGIIANTVNLIACNVLVRGDEALGALGLPALGLPKLGAFGAGVAFSVSCTVLAAFVLRAAWRLRPTVRNARVPLGLTLRLGVPIGLQLLAEVGVFTVGALLVGRFGAAAASAHQVAIGLASFSYMGALGVSGATAVRVGYAIGRGGSPRRAGFMGIALGAAFMSLGALAFALFPGPLVRLFTADSDTIKLGTTLLMIAAAFQMFDGVQAVAAGALRGAGDVRFSFAANVGAHWAVGFPLACFFGFVLGFGVRGIWWGLTSGLICISILLVSRFALISGRAIARV